MRGTIRGGFARVPAAAALMAATLAIGGDALAQAEPEVLLQGVVEGAEPARPDFADAGRAGERESMVSGQISSRGVADEDVLAALRRVPRHEFVPDRVASDAYDDTPLPIGHGQTISQPFIVAFMTEQLDLQPGDRVLEVGTGSAYQAAILGELARDVVSLEIIEPLARSAAERLERLGYRNITVLYGDGYYGHAPLAPYDAIIVTAAASHVPPPLLDQLRPGGRIAIPVGGGWTQNLLLIEKDAAGDTSSRNLMAVRFVPLTGGH